MPDPNLVDRMAYDHDEMPERVFSVSDPDSLGGILLHGYVGRKLWAVVCDHRPGEPRVGVLDVMLAEFGDATLLELRQYLLSELGARGVLVDE
jgi:hypothetical protein